MTKRFAKIPLLTVKQPYAWLIVAGYKDIDNRKTSWRYDGPVIIHVSRNLDKIEDAPFIAKEHGIKLPPLELLKKQTGYAIGIVDMIGCAMHHNSEWFDGKWGYMFANPRWIAPRREIGAQRVKWFINRTMRILPRCPMQSYH